MANVTYQKIRTRILSLRPMVRYGLLFVFASILFSLVLEIITIVQVGVPLASATRAAMFYITLFALFVVFFGSMAFLLGVSTGLLVEKIRK